MAVKTASLPGISSFRMFDQRPNNIIALGQTAVSPIADSEIVSNLNSRYYYMQAATSPPAISPPSSPPVGISRSEAIKLGVNKALREQGYALQQYTRTEIASGIWSVMVSHSKTYSTNYMIGAWAPTVSGIALGRTGRSSRLGIVPDYNPYLPQPAPPSGFNWAMFLSILGNAIGSIGEGITAYQMQSYSQQNYGQNMPTMITQDQYRYMLQDLMAKGLSRSAAEDYLGRLFYVQGGKPSFWENIPSWVLPVGVVAVVGLLVYKRRK